MDYLLEARIFIPIPHLIAQDPIVLHSDGVKVVLGRGALDSRSVGYQHHLPTELITNRIDEVFSPRQHSGFALHDPGIPAFRYEAEPCKGLLFLIIRVVEDRLVDVQDHAPTATGLAGG